MARLLRLCIIVGLLTFVASPPSFAAPTLQVSATEGLEQGQSITVGGSGFTPGLKGIAVGQCRVGYVGPSDCNLSGGATFRNADADGAIATVTIKLATSFGDIDCLKEPCIIAAAPLPTTSGPEEVAANTIEVPIYFGDAKPATAEAAPASVAAGRTGRGTGGQLRIPGVAHRGSGRQHRALRPRGDQPRPARGGAVSRPRPPGPAPVGGGPMTRVLVRLSILAAFVLASIPFLATPSYAVEPIGGCWVWYAGTPERDISSKLAPWANPQAAPAGPADHTIALSPSAPPAGSTGTITYSYNKGPENAGPAAQVKGTFRFSVNGGNVVTATVDFGTVSTGQTIPGKTMTVPFPVQQGKNDVVFEGVTFDASPFSVRIDCNGQTSGDATTNPRKNPAPTNVKASVTSSGTASGPGTPTPDAGSGLCLPDLPLPLPNPLPCPPPPGGGNGGDGGNGGNGGNDGGSGDGSGSGSRRRFRRRC